VTVDEFRAAYPEFVQADDDAVAFTLNCCIERSGGYDELQGLLTAYCLTASRPENAPGPITLDELKAAHEKSPDGGLFSNEYGRKAWEYALESHKLPRRI